MSRETTYYEFERPEGWRGEVVDMSTYDGEVDYFELEIEADVVFEIDHNYGADRDGNRGVTMDFSYVEDYEITLDGDFRPLLRKVRDFFLVPALKLSRAVLPPMGPGAQYAIKGWESLPSNREFTYTVLGEEIMTSSEEESIREDLFKAAEDRADDYYEPDYDDYGDRY